jgi:hypothetical protein
MLIAGMRRAVLIFSAYFATKIRGAVRQIDYLPKRASSWRKAFANGQILNELRSFRNSRRCAIGPLTEGEVNLLVLFHNPLFNEGTALMSRQVAEIFGGEKGSGAFCAKHPLGSFRQKAPDPFSSAVRH